MHSFSITIITLKHLTFDIVITRIGYYQTLGPIGLCCECTFCERTQGRKGTDSSNNVCRFSKVLKIIS